MMPSLSQLMVYKMAREDPSRSRGWDESAVPSFGASCLHFTPFLLTYKV
jgi:hypothetical protein